jgi:hypothetical protein
MTALSAPVLSPRERSRPVVERRGFGLSGSITTSQRMAVSVLSALSIAGVHSALNPSLFTLMSFATQPEAKERAMKGLWIGFGASSVASGMIWIVFEDWLPALISEATALGLFVAGVWALDQPPPVTIPRIEEQEVPAM